MGIALVTGATSGIGQEFAIQLAASGHNLIVVARRRARLDELAAKLSTKHGIQVEVLPADLADAAQLAVVTDRLARGDVELLVNNAGFAHGTPLTHNSLDDETRLIAVNIVAVQRLTQAALKPMLSRGAGEIINVASVAGFAPAWRNSGYSASKAWVINFSECVAQGVRNRGITVQALCPGYTDTEFFANHGNSRSWVPRGFQLDAGTVVRGSLRDLRRRKFVSIPTVRYKIVAALLRYTPHWLLRKLSLRGDPHPRG